MGDESDRVWDRFDLLTSAQSHQVPWIVDETGQRKFIPDTGLLRALIRVPLEQGLPVRSGIHAKAVDVWLSAELRRAGFGEDEIWPRQSRPRVLPREVAALIREVPGKLRTDLTQRLTKGISGVTSADASILGSAYFKQVDVVMSQWARGPELLISTKRMHSSLSNNALNRIEESYGDAHNLRGRHPLAAIGYVLLIRAEAIRVSPASAERLIDLVDKLATSGAYDATSVIVFDWADAPDRNFDHLELRDDMVPPSLDVGRFLGTMIERVLARTPINTHVAAREMWSGIRLAVEDEDARALDS